MKIIITCTDGELQAGNTYDVPDEKARELMELDKAIEVTEIKDEPLRKRKNDD
jgi:hypothetical protein